MKSDLNEQMQNRIQDDHVKLQKQRQTIISRHRQFTGAYILQGIGAQVMRVRQLSGMFYSHYSIIQPWIDPQEHSEPCYSVSSMQSVIMYVIFVFFITMYRQLASGLVSSRSYKYTHYGCFTELGGGEEMLGVFGFSSIQVHRQTNFTSVWPTCCRRQITNIDSTMFCWIGMLIILSTSATLMMKRLNLGNK